MLFYYQFIPIYGSHILVEPYYLNWAFTNTLSNTYGDGSLYASADPYGAHEHARCPPTGDYVNMPSVDYSIYYIDYRIYSGLIIMVLGLGGLANQMALLRSPQGSVIGQRLCGWPEESGGAPFDWPGRLRLRS